MNFHFYKASQFTNYKTYIKVPFLLLVDKDIAIASGSECYAMNHKRIRQGAYMGRQILLFKVCEDNYVMYDDVRGVRIV